MTLDQLEALADQAQYEYDNAINIAEGDIAFFDLFIAAANPATIKALVALCKQQNEALNLLRYWNKTEPADEAIAAYERFNGGTE